MKTAEERLEVLHARAQALKNRRNTAVMKGMGGASGVLMVCLVALIAMFSKGGHGITDSGYAGTSLLSENAGGYVLVAVIAFAVGVTITVMLVRHRKKMS